MNKKLFVLSILLLLTVMGLGCIDNADNSKRSLGEFFEESIQDYDGNSTFKTKVEVVRGRMDSFFIVGKVVEVNGTDDKKRSLYIRGYGDIYLRKINFEDGEILEVDRENCLYKNNTINGFSVVRIHDEYGRNCFRIKGVIF